MYSGLKKQNSSTRIQEDSDCFHIGKVKCFDWRQYHHRYDIAKIILENKITKMHTHNTYNTGMKATTAKETAMNKNMNNSNSTINNNRFYKDKSDKSNKSDTMHDPLSSLPSTNTNKTININSEIDRQMLHPYTGSLGLEDIPTYRYHIPVKPGQPGRDSRIR